MIDEVKKKVDLLHWTETPSGNTVTWSLPTQVQTVMKNQAVEQAMKIIDSRINAYGVKEPTLQRHGAESSGQILLQMPGVDDPERVKKLDRSESNLELMKIVSRRTRRRFRHTRPRKPRSSRSAAQGRPANKGLSRISERDEPTTRPPTRHADPNKPKQYVVVEYPAIVDGSELRDANGLLAHRRQTAIIRSHSNLKPGGRSKFGDWTGKNIGNYMGVVLNDEVKSAPVIKSTDL